VDEKVARRARLDCRDEAASVIASLNHFLSAHRALLPLHELKVLGAATDVLGSIRDRMSTPADSSN
jgi:hypothetical protein